MKKTYLVSIYLHDLWCSHSAQHTIPAGETSRKRTARAIRIRTYSSTLHSHCGHSCTTLCTVVTLYAFEYTLGHRGNIEIGRSLESIRFRLKYGGHTRFSSLLPEYHGSNCLERLLYCNQVLCKTVS